MRAMDRRAHHIPQMPEFSTMRSPLTAVDAVEKIDARIIDEHNLRAMLIRPNISFMIASHSSFLCLAIAYSGVLCSK